MNKADDIDTFLSRALGWLKKAPWTEGSYKGFLPAATAPYARLRPYPEITGYGLSLFSKLNRCTKEEEYSEMMKIAKDALVELQLQDGGFRYSLDKPGIITFDHAVMVGGLLDYCKLARDHSCESSIVRGLDYLVGIQRKDGSMPIASFNHTKLHSHFYLGKALIPLVKGYELTKDERYIRASEKLVGFLVENFFDGSMFRLNEVSYAQRDLGIWNRFHYLCYAVEGLISLEKYVSSLGHLINKMGTYLCENQAKSGATWYIFPAKEPAQRNVDLAATAQVARVLLYLHNKTKRDEYMRKALAALSYVTRKAHISRFELLNGGVPFGYHWYDRFVACTWATEFAIDAMLMLHYNAGISHLRHYDWF